MTGFFGGPKVDVVASSGMLRVTVNPRPNWLGMIAALAVAVFGAYTLYRDWAHFPLGIRVVWLWVVVSTVPLLVYQFFGEEIIEVDSRMLTIRKGVHGWERKREYRIEDCSELEWEKGRKGKSPGLTCRVGWRTVAFGDDLSEDDAIAILAALQQTLPAVAQKICAYPGGKEHFITLGLNR
jgi:hypothetical protein